MTEPRYGRPGHRGSPERPGDDPPDTVDPYGRPVHQARSYGQPPAPPPEYRDPRYGHLPGYQPAAPRGGESTSWFAPPGSTGPSGWNVPPGTGPSGWNVPPGTGPSGWNQPPGTEPPLPAPRRRARRVWIAIRLVVAITVLAVIAYSLIMHLTSHKPAHSAAGAPSSSQGAGSPGSAVSHPGDLRKYLITAPARSHPWPKPLGSHEKLSLRQAIRLANSNRATFAEYRFSGGAVRCWITVNSTWVDVRLYRFRSPGDAQAFFRFDTHRSARVTPAAGQSGIKGVPGARAFADLKPGNDGVLSVVAIGVHSDVVFIADVAEQARTARLGVVNKVMREQYGKL